MPSESKSLMSRVIELKMAGDPRPEPIIYEELADKDPKKPVKAETENPVKSKIRIDPDLKHHFTDKELEEMTRGL